MKIVRTLDTTNATYDLTGLNREQFSRLYSAYRELSYRLHDGRADQDELLRKLEAMANSDTLIV